MKFSVYGKTIEVVRVNNRWQVFYLGNEGKKRLASDIVLPHELKQEQLLEFIADLCHEWARPGKSEVTQLD